MSPVSFSITRRHLVLGALASVALQSRPVDAATSTQGRKKLAVVLGGGSARGFAHIGVIKALEAGGIHPDLIIGCSAGSLVGAFWAAGYSGTAMEDLAKSLPADKAALVVAYCGSEKCSAYKAGVDAATKLGYTNVKHFSGGLAGWTKAGEKLATAEAAPAKDAPAAK